MIRTIRHTLLRLCCGLLAILCLIPELSVQARATESPVPYIQQMIQYYRYYQDAADPQIQELLEYITYLDPQQGALWQNIMHNWSQFNREGSPSRSLPAGLPEDDSLCIVVLGYALGSDGSMRQELIGRLEVALEAAQQYPNAYIAVTGGPTASESPISEAEAMASWLTDRGIAPHRLILETRSRSTTYNAVNTYGILVRSYPAVSSIAIISSDYHIAWGKTMFQTVCDYTQVYGKTVIPVVAAAAYSTGSSMDTMYQQVKGICTITGIPVPKSGMPAL